MKNSLVKSNTEILQRVCLNKDKNKYFDFWAYNLEFRYDRFWVVSVHNFLEYFEQEGFEDLCVTNIHMVSHHSNKRLRGLKSFGPEVVDKGVNTFGSLSQCTEIVVNSLVHHNAKAALHDMTNNFEFPE